MRHALGAAFRLRTNARELMVLLHTGEDARAPNRSLSVSLWRIEGLFYFNGSIVAAECVFAAPLAVFHRFSELAHK